MADAALFIVRNDYFDGRVLEMDGGFGFDGVGHRRVSPPSLAFACQIGRASAASEGRPAMASDQEIAPSMTMIAESDEPRLLNDVPPPAIETIGLTRAFGDHVAVSNVAFSVRPGEIFGLIGPNGAGKSTLVKMLTTMLAPTSGRARVAGFDVAAESRKVRAHIG